MLYGVCCQRQSIVQEFGVDIEHLVTFFFLTYFIVLLSATVQINDSQWCLHVCCTTDYDCITWHSELLPKKVALQFNLCKG